MSRVTVLEFVLLSTLLMTFPGFGCGGEKIDPTQKVTQDCRQIPIRMAVASSLREIAQQLRLDSAVIDRPMELEFVFGASSTLARQLALGAPVDVFVSADATIVDDLVKRGLLVGKTRLEFARGRLALIASESWASQHALEFDGS